MATHKNIVCCDWGTSSLRLTIVDLSSGIHLSEYSGSEGISSVHEAWLNNAEKGRISRQDFFLRNLHNRVLDLVHDLDEAICIDALIISGMASSSIGLVELPYASAPFSLNGEHLISHLIHPGEFHPYPVWILSGLRYNDDVMRGEETQLMGLADHIAGLEKDEITCILPGTHSKHVTIQKGCITRFKTYITGELFAATGRYTVLRNSIAAPDRNIELSQLQTQAFIKGVKFASQHNLLHSLFSVRTNGLFNRFDPDENYYYLSGLFIGAELSALLGEATGPIMLVSSERLYNLYAKALVVLDQDSRVLYIAPDFAADAAILGQLKFFEHQMKK